MTRNNQYKQPFLDNYYDLKLITITLVLVELTSLDEVNFTLAICYDISSFIFYTVHHHVI